jgi:hypothetical protein
MTTQAQRFAKLLETFLPIYDSSDETIYILKTIKDNDMPLVFDSQGEKILCDLCNKQLFYDSGSISCENDRCEGNQ